MALTPKKVGNLKGPAPWTSPSAWAPNTAYQGSKAPASCVTYQRVTYVCTTDHTSSSAFDPTKFATLIPAPTDGAAGAAGSPGARGAANFSGLGPPSDAIIAGATTADSYLDLSNGDTYQFQ